MWIKIALASLWMDQNVTMAIEVVILDPIREFIPICTYMSASMYHLGIWGLVPPLVGHECHIAVTHRSLS